MPITQPELTAIIRGIGPAIREQFAQLRERIDQLDARIAAAESLALAAKKDVDEKPGIRYRGVFVDGEQYRPGDAITHAGSLWIAKADTRAMPSESHATWQLAVKRGRDGRDGKDHR